MQTHTLIYQKASWKQLRYHTKNHTFRCACRPTPSHLLWLNIDSWTWACRPLIRNGFPLKSLVQHIWRRSWRVPMIRSSTPVSHEISTAVLFNKFGYSKLPSYPCQTLNGVGFSPSVRVFFSIKGPTGSLHFGICLEEKISADITLR